VKRLDLPDGQWADLVEKPTHGDYVAILEAAEDAATGRGSAVAWQETIGRRFTKAWHVRSADGSLLSDVDDWDPVDPDITDAIITEAQNRWDDWQANRRPLVTRRTKRSRRASTGVTNGVSSETSSAVAPSM
jgi:hypothetical protein